MVSPPQSGERNEWQILSMLHISAPKISGAACCLRWEEISSVNHAIEPSLWAARSLMPRNYKDPGEHGENERSMGFQTW